MADKQYKLTGEMVATRIQEQAEQTCFDLMDSLGCEVPKDRINIHIIPPTGRERSGDKLALAGKALFGHTSHTRNDWTRDGKHVHSYDVALDQYQLEPVLTILDVVAHIQGDFQAANGGKAAVSLGGRHNAEHEAIGLKLGVIYRSAKDLGGEEDNLGCAYMQQLTIRTAKVVDSVAAKLHPDLQEWTCEAMEQIEQKRADNKAKAAKGDATDGKQGKDGKAKAAKVVYAVLCDCFNHGKLADVMYRKDTDAQKVADLLNELAPDHVCPLCLEPWAVRKAEFNKGEKTPVVTVQAATESATAEADKQAEPAQEPKPVYELKRLAA